MSGSCSRHAQCAGLAKDGFELVSNLYNISKDLPLLKLIGSLLSTAAVL